MNRLKFLIFIFLCTSFTLRGNEVKKSYFFSAEDRAAVMKSAETPQGKKILAHLKEIVSERRRHDLKVPLLEGGYLHDYFCPVHNLMFVFEWNKPYSHYCTECKKYWEGNNRYDWAWINKVHEANLQYLESCTYLYIATGDKIYAEYIRDMLLDYAGKYPTWFEHNSNRVFNPRNSGKMFCQSLDESVWASDAARAYSVAKEIMTPEEIKKIETGYLQPCADMLLKRKSGGNWQVWHNSGLIALGVALENDSIINVALNDPKCGYYYLMEKHVYSDGWWDEGSPIYHFYPLRAMLLSAGALRCRNIDLFDKKLYNMLISPALGTYADLSFPAHNDGWYGESLIAQVKLYEMGYSHYKDSSFRKILQRCYTKTDRLSAEALLNPEDFGSAVPDPEKSCYFADLGVGLLRFGNETVVLKYGPHGGGHGHPDKLSFSIHDGEHEILTDMGTSAYGVPDYKEWYHKTISHSTVVVDGKDQVPSAGKLVSFKNSVNGGSIEAVADQAYEGVQMKRKLTLDKKVLRDEFVCQSKGDHQYDYVLILTKPAILNGKGSVVQLNEPGYRRMKNLKKYNPKASFSCKTGDSEVWFTLPKNCSFEVFTGEAPGIPPTNPGVPTANHSERRPVQTCYPLIIRIRDANLNIKSNWSLK
jgi:hypothetical protein